MDNGNVLELLMLWCVMPLHTGLQVSMTTEIKLFGFYWHISITDLRVWKLQNCIMHFRVCEKQEEVAEMLNDQIRKNTAH